MRQIREHSVFLCILLSAALLRFIPLFDYQLTYDELSAVERTGYSSFHDLIEKGIQIDAHPALIQLWLHYLTKHFGYVTWMMRFPFILMSLGSIVYAYLFGLRNFSKQTGLIASSIFAFSLFYVFHAPIARMYSSGLFFALGTLYHFYEIVFRKNRNIVQYIALGFFLWISALNHHIGALFGVSVYLSGFFFIRRHSLKKYLATGTSVVLLYAPHIWITFHQLGLGGIGVAQGGWLEAPQPKQFLDLLHVIFGTGYGLAIVLILILSAQFRRHDGNWRASRLYLLGLFLFSFLVVFGYSMWRAPIYQHSVLSFASAALVLCAASLIDTTSQRVNYLLLGLLIAFLINQTYNVKAYFRECVHMVYEYQFQRGGHYVKQYGAQNVELILCNAEHHMKDLYGKKYGVEGCVLTNDSMLNNGYYARFDRGQRRNSSLRMFVDHIQNLKCEYLVISGSTPLQQAVIKDVFPYLIENTQTYDINFKVYARKRIPERTAFQDEVTFDEDNSNHQVLNFPGPPQNSDAEYPYLVTGNYKDLLPNEGNMLFCDVDLNSADTLRDLEICLNTETPGSGSLQYVARRAADFSPNPNSQHIYAELFAGYTHQRVTDSTRVQCFIWNRDLRPFTLKKCRIRVINYWPQRWNFWK